MTKIKLAIVDDHKLFRKGMVTILNEFPDVRVVIEAENGMDLFNKLEKTENLPDIILMDLNMPEMNGIDATEKLKHTHPKIKVIILSMRDEDLYIYQLIKKGALGYLCKDAEPHELERAVRAVYEDGYYFTKEVIRVMHNNICDKLPASSNLMYNGNFLNSRETQVLRLICYEKNSKEIAGQLKLSVRTVEGYRRELLTKTGAKNSAGLAIYAIRNGIINV